MTNIDVGEGYEQIFKGERIQQFDEYLRDGDIGRPYSTDVNNYDYRRKEEIELKQEWEYTNAGFENLFDAMTAIAATQNDYYTDFGYALMVKYKHRGLYIVDDIGSEYEATQVYTRKPAPRMIQIGDVRVPEALSTSQNHQSPANWVHVDLTYYEYRSSVEANQVTQAIDRLLTPHTNKG